MQPELKRLKMRAQMKHPGAEMPREILPLVGTAAILAGGKSSRMGFDKQLAK